MAKQGTLFSTEHIAKNDHVKKLGLLYIPSTKLAALPGFNDRVDYGTTEEMNELAESIYRVGPKVPLKGYKDGDGYVVIVGHRRLRAAEMIKKKYGKTIVFPVQMYSPGTSKKDMLLDTLLTNSGKDLTPLEKASCVFNLVQEGTTIKECCSALGGVSEVYVKNLKKLWELPEEAKDLIRSGVVSSTFLIGYIKKKGTNIENLIAELRKQAEIEGKNDGQGKRRRKKQAKITARNVSGGLNSLKELKRFIKQAGDNFENKAKKDIFGFICGILNNEKTYDDIFNYFTGK